MSDVSLVPDDVYQVLGASTLLFEKEAISQGVKNLAQRNAENLSDKNPLFICLMNGGLMFSAELLKHFDFPLQLDYIHLSRYQDDFSGGELEWKAGPNIELESRNVVLLDDILDEGKSLQAAHEYCLQKGASSVSSFVLLKKNLESKKQVFDANDFVFECPDKYVFGYGK
jgi:hypoxanthine phosphoribosyltransferase